jgi:hypothetical protein
MGFVNLGEREMDVYGGLIQVHVFISTNFVEDGAVQLFNFCCLVVQR